MILHLSGCVLWLFHFRSLNTWELFEVRNYFIWYHILVSISCLFVIIIVVCLLLMQKNKWDFFVFLVLEVSAMVITGGVALTSKLLTG